MLGAGTPIVDPILQFRHKKILIQLDARDNVIRLSTTPTAIGYERDWDAEFEATQDMLTAKLKEFGIEDPFEIPPLFWEMKGKFSSQDLPEQEESSTSEPMKRISLTAMWSEELEALLKQRCTESFCMTTRNDQEKQAISLVVNQGIDSHLGGFTGSTFDTESVRWRIELAPREIPVMVRRLLEVGDEEVLEVSHSLASGICEQYQIELV